MIKLPLLHKFVRQERLSASLHLDREHIPTMRSRDSAFHSAKAAIRTIEQRSSQSEQASKIPSLSQRLITLNIRNQHITTSALAALNQTGKCVNIYLPAMVSDNRNSTSYSMLSTGSVFARTGFQRPSLSQIPSTQKPVISSSHHLTKLSSNLQQGPASDGNKSRRPQSH